MYKLTYVTIFNTSVKTRQDQKEGQMLYSILTGILRETWSKKQVSTSGLRGKNSQ